MRLEIWPFKVMTKKWSFFIHNFHVDTGRAHRTKRTAGERDFVLSFPIFSKCLLPSSLNLALFSNKLAFVANAMTWFPNLHLQRNTKVWHSAEQNTKDGISCISRKRVCPWETGCKKYDLLKNVLISRRNL